MIREAFLQMTFEFENLSDDAMDVERTKEFKDFIKERYVELVGSSGMIPIPSSAYKDEDFESKDKLRALADAQMRRLSSDKATVPNAAFGPICYPDPEDPASWIRARSFLLADAKGADLAVGPLKGFPGISPSVRKEIESMQLSVMLRWHHLYGSATTKGGSAGAGN